MSRIFGDAITSLMDRIDASFPKPSAARQQAGEREFATVLRDLENGSANKELAPEESPLASIGKALGEQLDRLSNLTFDERMGIGEPTLATLVVPPAEHPDARASLAIPPETVKSAPSPVKTPTPAPKVAQPVEDTPKVPELDVSLPATPQIIGGGWTRVKADYGPIAMGREEVEGLIRSTGRFHQVDPNLSLAVAEAESSFDTNAVSKDGHHSKGLFQLLDSTGREMQGLLGVQEAYDPFDAPQNAFLGIGYLKRLFEMFGKETVLTRDLTTHPARTADDLEKLAVAAFNAGQGAVARAQRKALLAGEDPGSFRAIEKHLPAQTRAYVGRVFEYRLAHQQNDPSQMTA